MNAPIGHFHGGLHPPEHKHESASKPIRVAPVPKRLYLPLQQHRGAEPVPLVKVGQHVLKGERIADAPAGLGTPVHAPTSGTVVAIESRPMPHPSALAVPTIVIEADGMDVSLRMPPCPDPLIRPPDVVADCIRRAGVVGLGGAVFPTHAKLRRPDYKPIETLVINAAECEPYITCDDRLMRERPAEILDGIRILAHALQAKTCLLGIEDNKPQAEAALQAALEGTDLAGRVAIVTVPTVYPSGGERQLIKLLTGREVPSGGLPLDIGVVCVNVGTAAAVHRALRHSEPLISRIVTVTGAGVAEPCNIEARIGTPIGELIALAGGYVPPVTRLIMGGPLMGFALPDDQLPVVKATNCIIAAHAAELRPSAPPMPCIRCGFCARDCPASLLPQQLYWFARAKDWEQVEQHHIFDCIECGICAYVCPSHIPLVNYFRYAKSEIRAERHNRALAEQARIRHAAREQRLAREAAERARARETKKAALDQPPAAMQSIVAAAVERVQRRRQAPREATETETDTAA
jgi:electron transport complex protein RnfC